MITTRKLELGDLEKGFLDILKQIAPLSNESKELYQETSRKEYKIHYILHM